MIVFDTDVLVEILKGNSVYVQRAAEHPDQNQSIPIVAIEEIYRGRLNSIRRAETRQGKLTVPRAYALFERTTRDFQGRSIASYDDAAHTLFTEWRNAKVRVATHDLRIAAICVSRGAALITRNRRDFE